MHGIKVPIYSSEKIRGEADIPILHLQPLILFLRRPIGKLMSVDREQFFTDIWGPYSLWQDRDYLLSQAQPADPVQLAKTGDATEAFNYVQENREDGAKHPPVDQLWYDEATQPFHWKGPRAEKR